MQFDIYNEVIYAFRWGESRPPQIYLAIPLLICKYTLSARAPRTVRMSSHVTMMTIWLPVLYLRLPDRLPLMLRIWFR